MFFLFATLIVSAHGVHRHHFQRKYASNGIASSGTAYFLTSVKVRAGPSTSSEHVATYSKGESVKYDKVVKGDGRTWISYIGGSGNRRYCCAIDTDGSQYISTSTSPVNPTQAPTPIKKSISQKGLEFIAGFEGLLLTAYWDSYGKVWTIGYGHTSGVYPGQTITKQQALNYLRSDCQFAANAVNKYVKVSINQNQFDALVSFTFNLGAGAFAGSDLLKYLNQGKIQAAANEFPLWCHAGGQVLPGLVRRRNAEKALFLSKK